MIGERFDSNEFGLVILKVFAVMLIIPIAAEVIELSMLLGWDKTLRLVDLMVLEAIAIFLLVLARK